MGSTEHQTCQVHRPRDRRETLWLRNGTLKIIYHWTLLLIAVCVVNGNGEVLHSLNRTHVLRFAAKAEGPLNILRHDINAQSVDNVGYRPREKSRNLNLREKDSNEHNHVLVATDDGSAAVRGDHGQRSVHADFKLPHSVADRTDTSHISQQSSKGKEDSENRFDYQSSFQDSNLVLAKLTHSAHYNKVLVRDTEGYKRIYIPTIDHFRCGLCVCYKDPEHQMVHANCVRPTRVEAALENIPQDLPSNLFYIDMDNNCIRHLEVNKLAKYQILQRLEASRNQIEYLNKLNCDIPVNLRYLNLSQNFISHIEDGALVCLQNLTHLILSGNQITQLTNDSLTGLVNLMVLDLSNNKLYTIQPRTFVYSPGLLALDFSFNEHFLESPRKFVKVFRPLKALETLNIQGCSSYGRYPTEVLLVLPALRYLFLNGEKSPFDRRLKALKNLTTLVIGNTAVGCWTKNFTKSYFNGLVYLESVKIHGCKAKEYSPEMFKANPRLNSFELVREMRNMSSVFPILCYFPRLDQMRSIKIMHTIKHTRLDPLITLTSNEATCLRKMKNLVTLNLDWDSLSQIKREFTSNLPSSLETISLRGNLLISFQSLLYQIISLKQVLPNLKNLFEDGQGMDPTEKRDLSYLTEPETHLSCEDGHRAAHDLLALDSLDAQRSLLVARRKQDTNPGPKGNFSLSPYHYKPHYMDIYSASKTINLGRYIFMGKSYIEVGFLDVSNTLISDWGVYPIISMPEHTIIAKLSDNRCQAFNESFFPVKNSLVELHADGNFLGPLLSRDVNGTKLSRLRYLEYLDLSRNNLFSLPWRLFNGLSRLRVLRLRLNDVGYIDFRVAHMSSLVFVDLAKNSISSISERMRNELDYLATKGNVSIDLTYNPIPCTCHGLGFLNWMSLTRVHILNKDFLVCIDGNNKQVLVGDLPTRVLALKRDCLSKRLLILACSFSLVVILLLTGVVWTFQKRWWILYMWNLAISKLYGFKGSHSRNSTSPRYTFDAFFVYSAAGRDFVLDRCLEELEVTRGHRVCVEDRDFLAGSYIPCNITSAVRASRTTVVVLNEQFRAEGWVQYAVQMALVEAVRSKRNVLHLLFVGSPPEGRLPGTYLKVLRDGLFSEFPPTDCRPEVTETFWDAFSAVLGHTDAGDNRPHPRLELID